MSQPIYRLPDDLRIDATFLMAAEGPRNWGFDKCNVAALHERTKGDGVVVAVLDTGCDAGHAEFAGGAILEAKDFSGSRIGARDGHGHGTHCMGTVLGRSAGIGMAPGAKGLVGKVLGDSGSGGGGDIAAGLRWAADNGADIISMSLGGPGYDPTQHEGVKYATSKGCWVVVAAGNERQQGGTTGSTSPAQFPQCLTIAAVDEAGKIAGFSNRGNTNLSIAAGSPGTNIISAKPNGGYQSMSGTSMATPFAAGVLALLRAILKNSGKPMWPTDVVKQWLGSWVVDAGKDGLDTDFGPGVPDLALWSMDRRLFA